MIFCADDYGQSSSINAAIIDLVGKNKIQAVSVLVKSVSQGDAEHLKLYGDQIQIGLHLDLFANLQPDITSEIENQIEEFRKLFQKFPDYIDGHMHCHIYPVFGTGLIKTLRKYARPSGFYLRSVTMHPALLSGCGNLKYLYLVWLNILGRRFKKNLVRAGMKSNDYCWGVYGGHAAIGDVYGLAAKNGSDNDIFFLHPDKRQKTGKDPANPDYDFAKNLHSSQNRPSSGNVFRKSVLRRRSCSLKNS